MVDRTIDDYLTEINRASNRYGDKLMALMITYNKPNLASITYEEAKDFYEKNIKK